VLSLDKQLEVIRRGVVEIVPENELVDKLKHSIESGKPLRIKLGLIPPHQISTSGTLLSCKN
jgi:tyrosyl-tRNA synthetase